MDKMSLAVMKISPIDLQEDLWIRIRKHVIASDILVAS